MSCKKSKKMKPYATHTAATLLALLTLHLAGCGGGEGEASKPNEPEPTVKLSVLSAPSHRVMGSAALIQFEPLKLDPDAQLAITANGVDVRHVFRLDSKNGQFLGNVSNLREGNNEIVATYGDYSDRLHLTSYPRTGPVFSGPQQQLVCGYASFTRLGGATLPPLGDDKCSTGTLVSYFYRNSTGGNSSFNPATALSYPANMVYLQINSRSVPFLVRLESGTVNRSLYQSAILHDALNETVPSPASRPTGWNGKLIYTTTGGCGANGLQQGNDFATLINSDYMTQGYAVVSATLNVGAVNCNDVVAAETVMAVKEQFTRSYGRPVYTIGFANTTGNGAQPLQIADNYPGLFDGVITTQVMPDMTTGLLMKLFDARLLDNFFNANAGWTDAQKRAVSGFITVSNIAGHSTEAGRTLDPTAATNYPSGIAVASRYHPVTNRTGLRATSFDAARNVWGVNDHGHALRPIDNIGVQYGLKALNDGIISAEEFVTLNEGVGGLDLDFQPQAARTTGDMKAIERGYRSGRVLSGGGGLAMTPIIERRNYVDATTTLHMKIHSYSLRERLNRANGHFDNHVILSQSGFISATGTLASMDEWLMGARNDTTPQRTLAEKIQANRPATLKDACWISGTKTEEMQTAFGSSTCNLTFPSGRTPRMVAGGPLSDDILKCQLKPLLSSDYSVTFTPAQWLRLATTFPDGVCDWSKPSVNYRPLAGTWLSFGPMPTNLLVDMPSP